MALLINSNKGVLSSNNNNNIDTIRPQEAKIQSFEILAPQGRHRPKLMSSYYVTGGVAPVLDYHWRSQI